MIQIRQLNLPVSHTGKDLEEKIRKTLRIKEEQLLSYRIARRSLDARKKQDIHYSYVIEADTDADERIAKRLHSGNIQYLEKQEYRFCPCGKKKLDSRPVIAGCGPAGLFCAYMLAKAGYAPLLIERGKPVRERQKDVSLFWKENRLQTDSNVQFGEGGAGAFSDGKLNTLVKDPSGRGRKALEIFISCGAPKEIAYEAKPHIGTDLLASVIPRIRQEISAMGGSVRFESCLTDIRAPRKSLAAVELNHKEWIDAQALVLAIGHSARDTFEMLLSRGIWMEAKPFAVGLRVEHLQEMISQRQYKDAARLLPPADYKVTAKAGGRGVYSFCMCPGGYVVNASSEEGGLAVNGMSYQKRDGENANSAVVVSAEPKDFGGEGPLSGVRFQRGLERAAFSLLGGAIPQQLYGDFKRGTASSSYGGVISKTCGTAGFANLRGLLPRELCEAFLCGMEQFAKKIPGFDCDDAVLSGVESRTSSPVRIPRDERLESSVRGIYPCGEGAGYAGGIMSAAMDGIRAAEAVASLYAPLEG